MITEIGSNFWETECLEKGNNSLLWWKQDDYNIQYYKSGRNAIKALCKNIGLRKKVAIPIYTCDTVIQPFLDEKWDVVFYKINKDLSICDQSLDDVVNKDKPDVIFFHSFFGFNTYGNTENIIKYKNQGIVIVEDLTQSLFSNHFLKMADYYVTSFRKFIAIADGGALISKKKLTNQCVSDADNRIVETALIAFETKKEYFDTGNSELKILYRKKYQELNSLISNNEQLMKMSDYSRKIIDSCNIKLITDIRQKNYEYLLHEIEEIGFVKTVLELSIEKCTPLYLPIYVTERAEVQKYLAEHNVYCPIIWPKSNSITFYDSDVDYMYNSMLCIPIDQRYSIEDMKKVVCLLLKYQDERGKENWKN